MRDTRAVALMPVLICVTATATFGAHEAAWPCCHGAQRNNHSADTGLLETWPQYGPELLWTAAGIGLGYSSVEWPLPTAESSRRAGSARRRT
ncbi:MAG: hypothetical protein COZ06_19535 [Armatimonadetes bacterium CG_4_10_14_3_um_filter_66_18]|nr:hypothetical protein [Armatimonadota bacterium]OIP04843.1 MAG: hypothetical protein AUJ96_11920 [Armatimonadetes bacterium CG2_30_66_41]PIU95010.1 MAG: hypothetical protein COS65_04630 [Armatimonadetes bacterium CG06_land_8_20_14_3_00_66_21]PIW15669.1 MAG: hypothetical protein COW34_06600 [Armatimonadetes bacterium CG17_big_fil_post_rev_8_21_14_2_50_66_6]PIX39053.1 MAG: hypothetical protein COZ57_29070 [Armatimonadetes bacterium CG_4_8_14_3_um_filter_66_20]PIY44976.1 MAG: hypothetical prote